MITLTGKRNDACFVEFVWEGDARIRSCRLGLERIFHGGYLETLPVPFTDRAVLLIGCGKKEDFTPGLIAVKEVLAAAAAKCRDFNIRACSMDVSCFIQLLGPEAFTAAVLGLGLGCYRYRYQPSENEEAWDCDFQLENGEAYTDRLKEAQELLAGICFARNMVNMPGNHLRPMDFDRIITAYEKDVEIEAETLVYGQLRVLNMEALYSVGQSSEYPPCLLILRYRGNPDSDEIYGLIGKGITCDTGGYCLKSSDSMGGIKSDMAGAAAVAAAIHAAASQRLKVNVTACLPLSENRISRSALLPGDVITGFGGRTIEVLNTDAEGRLVLSDAVSYAIRREGVTSVLDIATLTGAVGNMLGNTIAGAMSDDDNFYALFERALEHSGEQYLRLPFGREHEKMIKSDVADVKNVGGGCCATITAGLFIRSFCEGRPWLHLDIAGTAWCGSPAYAFDSKGATGAGVTTLYYLLKEASLPH